MPGPYDIVTVGHAIVDVLAPSPDQLPTDYGMEKGTMTLIDEDQAKRLYHDLGPAVESSGGSAANTAAGVADLGGSVMFMGRVRDDQLGMVFTHDIRAAGVAFDVPLAAAGPGTGLCMVMVHDDAQRTMATYLGAGGLLAPGDVDADCCRRAQIVYVEGYLVGKPETQGTVSKAAAACHQRGGRFALSLSDPYWVELKTAALRALLDDVDVLFGNEEEVAAITGSDLSGAVAELSRSCDIVAVTRGAQGSLVASEGRVVEVPAHPVDQLVDTTGAGDMYAAGFLYGMTREFDLEECARLGSLAAAEVIGHLGARPQMSLRKLAALAGIAL